MSALESTELPPEPVDISVLISLAEAHEDGEPDLVVELIDLYLADTHRRVADMRTGLTTTDAHLLGGAAHALKGGSSTLGAVRVADTCDELEQLARDLAFARVPVVLERLEQELTTVRSAFLTERQKRSGSLEVISGRKSESGDVLTPPPLS